MNAWWTQGRLHRKKVTFESGLKDLQIDRTGNSMQFNWGVCLCVSIMYQLLDWALDTPW